MRYGIFLRAAVGRPQPSDCLADCIATPSCAFFSHSRRFKKCIMCGSCEMEASGSFVTGKIRELSMQYTSWSLLPLSSFGAITPQATTGSPFLSLQLQRAYSHRLYNAPGLVELSTLRVVWLSLLPRAALVLLNATTGICKLDATPPFHPFFASIDLYNSPLGALWISRSGSGRTQPIPNHSWAEITHCAQGALWELEAVAKPRPAWKCKPMWLYVAPGSGVSINVGRSIVVPDFIEASRLLAQAFPGDLKPGPASPVSTKRRVAREATTSGVGDDVWWTPGHRTKRKVAMESSRERPRQGQRGTAHARARFHTASPPPPEIDFSQIDSIQILENWEFYSNEPRHELIMLRLKESDTLTEATPGLRCGRHPHLTQCPPDSEAIARVSSCGDHRRVARVLQQRYDVKHRRHCAADVPACFRNGSSAERMCAAPGALAAVAPRT